jgi:hypothetical protein
MILDPKTVARQVKNPDRRLLTIERHLESTWDRLQVTMKSYKPASGCDHKMDRIMQQWAILSWLYTESWVLSPSILFRQQAIAIESKAMVEKYVEIGDSCGCERCEKWNRWHDRFLERVEPRRLALPKQPQRR